MNLLPLLAVCCCCCCCFLTYQLTTSLYYYYYHRTAGLLTSQTDRQHRVTEQEKREPKERAKTKNQRVTTHKRNPRCLQPPNPPHTTRHTQTTSPPTHGNGNDAKVKDRGDYWNLCGLDGKVRRAASGERILETQEKKTQNLNKKKNTIQNK